MLYRSVEREYEHSVGGRLFTAEWWIIITVIPRRTPCVQGATGLPRMRMQPVGDVRGQPPWSFIAPHSGCTKFPLVA